MNDYRSTFSGANDHEADWEQVFVYLEDAPGGPAAGLDRGRRPRLHRRRAAPALGRPDAGQGGRPPGALRRRRLARLLLRAGRVPHPACRSPALRGVTRLAGRAAATFWRDTLRQPDPGDLAPRLRGALSASVHRLRARRRARPWARAGRPTLDPGAHLDDDAWVDGYRGLFGLDTYDRFAGERAPAGPKYTRVGHAAPVLARPARVRGPGQGGAAVPLARGARERAVDACEAERGGSARRGSSPRPSRCRGWRWRSRRWPCDGSHGDAPRRRASRAGRRASWSSRGLRASAGRHRRPAGGGAPRELRACSRPATWATRGRTSGIRIARCRPRTPATASSWSSGRPSASALLLLMVVGARLVPHRALVGGARSSASSATWSSRRRSGGG